MRGIIPTWLQIRMSPQVANGRISVLAPEHITVGGGMAANRLMLAGNVIQHPLYEGVSVVGTRDDGVHFPPGFVVAFYLLLPYPVMEGSIHVPLNQIQLLFRKKLLGFADVNGGNRKALPPRLRYQAVDTHEVRGRGLF